MGLGLRGVGGNPAASPYTHGPYTWDQQVTFSQGVAGVNSRGTILYVDGSNGSDTNDGQSWSTAKKTIQAAVTAVGADGVVFVLPKLITDMAGDPTNYAEAIIIPATHGGMSLIGVNRGRTQLGLPQIKPAGTTHTWILKIRAPGCYIAGLGFNGNSTAGAPLNGAILLDDDGSAKSACGTTIENCHFKNCCGTTVTDCRTGGAIDWPAAGNAWQVRIVGNRFYKNVCDICLLGTSSNSPQDVIIESNHFSGPTASVDTNLYLAGGSGMDGVHVCNNTFGPIGTLGGAVVKRVISATGCVGIFSGNMVETTGLTFGALGSGGLIPTTMMIAGNFQDHAVIARA